MFRIGIIDDHQLFAEGLATMLRIQPGIEKIVSLQDEREVILFLKSNNINVVLLDINMPHINGIDLINVIRKEFGVSMKVIIVSTRIDIPVIQMALSAGANGYCTKNTSARELMTAIDVVGSGKKYICREMQNAMKNPSDSDQPNPKVDNLSEREKEVLRLLHQGFATRRIAETLFISEHTVASHRKNLLTKLEANSTIEMLSNAIKRGLL